MPIVGPRFLVEAGFIIAVAVVAGIERPGTWWIIALVAGAWVIVALVEVGVWARQAGARPATPRVRPEPVAAPPPPPVALPERRPERPVLPPPMPAPEPEPEPKPEAPRIAVVPPPVPEPEPEAEAEREPEPQPEPERVVALASRGGPREWNLWELERAVRDHSGDDVARDEERAYLLMYLREFAGADGMLPLDFDGLVRDAFGDLLRAIAT